MWPLAERLARSYRALVVHLPGYGRSAPIEPYAMDHSHTLVEETLAQRGVHDAHVVGFSGGAYRAFALAVRGNLHVRSVVSLAGAANFTDEEKKGLVQYVAMLRDGVDAAPILVELMLSPRGRESPAAVEDVRSWATAISAEHLARELEAFVAAPDLRPQLGALDIPVLARVGSIDAAAPPERSRRIIEAILHPGPAPARTPGSTLARVRNDRAKLEEVPGVGHVLLREDFESTLASIERHLTTEIGRRD